MSSGNGTTPHRGFKDCTEVTLLCPVEATVLGYTPNLGSSIFFTTVFGILTIASAYLSIRKRTWSYGAFLTAGLILETVGYIGRALMHNNPWNEQAFEIQICCIIIGPTFLCAAIYLTLKHLSLNLNPALSRIRPRLYPYIFLPGDLTCLIVQAIGGGIASAAGKTNEKLLKGGNNAIIAGVALQVVVLLAFGVLGLDYWMRVRKYIHGDGVDPQALALWRDPKFRRFGFAVSGAYVTVLVRCIYRIAEMSGGWGNFIMQDEPSFLVLDSSLVVVATSLLTIFHPGIYFPQMGNARPRKAKGEKSSGGNESSGSAESSK